MAQTKTHRQAARPALLGTPAYSIPEAAQYLLLPPSTVRSWVRGGTYPTVEGERNYAPIVEIASPEEGLLSFTNLVELHVLSSVRRAHGVKMAAVRRAVAYLSERLGLEHPLATARMFTDGVDLFVDGFGELLSASSGGQLAMRSVLLAYLDRVERDNGEAVRLYPVTRQEGTLGPRSVFIDPAIRFGKPCIAANGIPTGIVGERYRAGESVRQLARDYARPPSEIEEAIRFEFLLAAA